MNNKPLDAGVLKKRYAYITSAFDMFKSEYGGNIRLDKLLLQHVLRSWGIDEERHKEFHMIETMRHYKQAAYFAYWFTKLKPIQVELKSVHDRACLANERFALSISLNMLSVPTNSINKELLEKLEYMLRYRKFSAESLFVTFELLKKCSLV
jgi:hypothetical protein